MTQLFRLPIIVVTLCGLSIFGHCYIQEVILYESESEDNGMFVPFTSSVSDATIYGLESMKRFCARGFWTFYNNTGFTEQHLALSQNDGIRWDCRNESFPFKSFRHYGHGDTEKDGMSLMTEHFYNGDELYVDGSSEYGGISVQINSFLHTGPSNWTLFEGTNFDGKSVCVPGNSNGGLRGYYFLQYLLNMTTIGSLRMDC